MMDMNCDQTEQGWFEVKAFVQNGEGWETDISQTSCSGIHVYYSLYIKCVCVHKIVKLTDTTKGEKLSWKTTHFFSSRLLPDSL